MPTDLVHSKLRTFWLTHEWTRLAYNSCRKRGEKSLGNPEKSKSLQCLDDFILMHVWIFVVCSIFFMSTFCVMSLQMGHVNIRRVLEFSSFLEAHDIFSIYPNKITITLTNRHHYSLLVSTHFSNLRIHIYSHFIIYISFVKTRSFGKQFFVSDFFSVYLNTSCFLYYLRFAVLR